MSDFGAHMQAFVDEECEEFAAWLEAEARVRILRRNIKVDEVLLNSLAVKYATNELQMWFSDHGRMHDMGAGRMYHKGKYMGPEERLGILKGRKPSKWYSRLAWGSVYGTLANNLANKYVSEAPKLLVREFNKGL